MLDWVDVQRRSASGRLGTIGGVIRGGCVGRRQTRGMLKLLNVIERKGLEALS
jgi:hypothetical protein